MEQSLSLVLPVHNAQAELSRQLTLLLDILPDLTTRFEVLIIDDGSTDRTEEVAHELSRRFPQVGVFRHSRRSGTTAAARTGLRQTRGDVVIVLEDAKISPSRLRQVWRLRHDQRLVMAKVDPPPAQADASVVDRLMSWGSSLKKTPSKRGAQPGIHMIRRPAVIQLEPEALLTVEST